MKYVGFFFVGIIGLVLLWGLGIALGIITLPAHTLNNKVQLNHDIIDDTVNAKNCEQWQDWFRTQEGTIKTLQQTVDNAQQALDDFNQRFPDSSKWTDAQQQQYTVLTDNLTGARNEANDAVNAYNAKAQQENLAYCKNGLPLYIHPF